MGRGLRRARCENAAKPDSYVVFSSHGDGEQVMCPVEKRNLAIEIRDAEH